MPFSQHLHSFLSHSNQVKLQASSPASPTRLALKIRSSYSLKSRCINTVDGSEILHQLIGSLSMFIPLFYQGFIHPTGGWEWGFLNHQAAWGYAKLVSSIQRDANELRRLRRVTGLLVSWSRWQVEPVEHAGCFTLKFGGPRRGEKWNLEIKVFYSGF